MTVPGARTRRGGRGLLALLALVVLAGRGAAGEDEALRLLRKARALAADPATRGEARDALAAARVEMPGSPYVFHAMGDLNLDEGAFREATDDYLKGQTGPFRFRSHFNQAVARHALAESQLQEAGVPLVADQLPPGAPPGPLLQAIDGALPVLEAARGNLMEALALQPDAEARESVAALNRRIDELLEMKRRLEEQQEQQEQEEGDEDPEEDEQDQDDEEEQQEQEDQSQQDEEQEGEDEQDEGEQPQDDPQQDEQEQEQPEDEGQEEEQEASPESRPLTPAEMEELLEQLEDLEEQALRLARERRKRERESPEKDW